MGASFSKFNIPGGLERNDPSLTRLERNDPLLELFPHVQEDGDHVSPDLVLLDLEALKARYGKVLALVFLGVELLKARYRQELASAEERHRQERASDEERHRQERASDEERHRQERASDEERHRQELASAEERHRKSQASQQQKYHKELDALMLRQLFHDFKKTKSIDAKLMEQARKKFPGDFCKSERKSFLGMVIFLATQKIELREQMKDLDPSSDCCKCLTSQLGDVERKLAFLKKVATTFETDEMLWTKSIGEGYYAYCFLVLGANKTCHPELTKEVLDDMYKLAQRGVYKYGQVDLQETVIAFIDKVYPP